MRFECAPHRLRHTGAILLLLLLCFAEESSVCECVIVCATHAFSSQRIRQRHSSIQCSSSSARSHTSMHTNSNRFSEHRGLSAPRHTNVYAPNSRARAFKSHQRKDKKNAHAHTAMWRVRETRWNRLLGDKTQALPPPSSSPTACNVLLLLLDTHTGHLLKDRSRFFFSYEPTSPVWWSLMNASASTKKQLGRSISWGKFRRWLLIAYNYCEWSVVIASKTMYPEYDGRAHRLGVHHDTTHTQCTHTKC